MDTVYVSLTTTWTMIASVASMCVVQVQAKGSVRVRLQADAADDPDADSAGIVLIGNSDRDMLSLMGLSNDAEVWARTDGGTVRTAVMVTDHPDGAPA